MYKRYAEIAGREKLCLNRKYGLQLRNNGVKYDFRHLKICGTAACKSIKNNTKQNAKHDQSCNNKLMAL